MREADRRAIERADWSVFVFCDSDKHAGRRVAVTNFLQFGPLGSEWHERVSSYAVRRPGTGMQLIGDEVAPDGWALDPEVSNADVRKKFDVRCRRCGASAPARPATLFRSLDSLRAAGLTEVAVRELAASLGRSKAR